MPKKSNDTNTQYLEDKTEGLQLGTIYYPGASASAHPRADGRWQGKLTTSDDIKYIYADSKEQRDIELIQLIADTIKTKDNDITYGEWIKQWFELYKNDRVRPSTIHSYTYTLGKWILPHLGNCQLSGLTSIAIQKVVNAIDKPRQRQIAITLLRRQ